MNPDTGILYTDLQEDRVLFLRVFLKAYREGDHTLLRVFHGIRKEIGHRLFHTDLIAAQIVRDSAVDMERQRQPLLLRTGLYHVHQIIQYGRNLIVHRDDIEFPGLHLGEIEDIVDQAQERITRGPDMPGVHQDVLVFALSEHHFIHTEDRVHRRTNIVGHRRQEIRLRAIGTLGRTHG